MGRGLPICKPSVQPCPNRAPEGLKDAAVARKYSELENALERLPEHSIPIGFKPVS